MKELRTSIRDLVEYVYQGGSIDRRLKSTSSLLDGTRAHQLVQSSYNENDQKEVSLKYTYLYDDIQIHIEGRCDGLLDKDIITIDEIKSTTWPLSNIEKDSYPVHWAQAKCYAFIYAKDHELLDINVQITYIHLPSNELKQFEQIFSLSELTEWISNLIENYIPYAQLITNHQEKKIKSIKSLSFPYPAFRVGQRNFAGAVYKTITDHQTLFAHAPTGTGKTISTIFPTIKAIGEGEIEKFIYLTAKTITRQAAEEALVLMNSNGLHLHTVTITAKEKICFTEDKICQPNLCPYANGHYERINYAILDILSYETLMTREVIVEYAKKHNVCPFEFSLDLAYNSDAIICDYNYIFDPRVSLKRLWNEMKKKTTLLIDEAHNLVDRSRDMFSALISKSSFLEIKKEYKSKNKGLSKSANRINLELLSIKKSMSENKMVVQTEIPKDLVKIVDIFISDAEKELFNQDDAESKLLDTFFMALNFSRISSLYHESHVTYIRQLKNEVEVKLFCIDPSSLLQKITKSYNSTIFFSATFAPFDFYKDMLGWTSEDYTFSIPSPFPREHLELFIQPTSTRYKDRERSIEKIVATIIDIERKQPGNYLIFFPSYIYMEQVYSVYQEQNQSTSVIVQSSNMTENDREEFLLEFNENRNDSLIAFAVLGGIFSEGIDLTGNRLNGVIVVSVGLPKLNDEQDIIKDYFNQRGKNGFDYAYMYPGLNKVLQAGGRLIRTETDKGVIILIDDRFLQNRYKFLLPPQWQNFQIRK